VLVRDAMARRVVTVGAEETVTAAAAKMREQMVGALPVRAHDRTVGMLTDRDITTRVTARGLDPSRTSVRAVMTPGAIYCFDRDPLAAADEVMQARAISRLVVLDGDMHLVGIVSRDDLRARATLPSSPTHPKERSHMADRRWGHCQRCRFFDSPAPVPMGNEEARCRQPDLIAFELLVFGASGCNAFELREGVSPAAEQPAPQP
jgi:CBS domain-containing protein